MHVVLNYLLNGNPATGPQFTASLPKTKLEEQYIYIYIYARPPPHDPHIWPREGGFGRGGTPDSRFPEKRVPGPRTPDSRFPEKIWSTPRLQTPDFSGVGFPKKSGVPPDSRLQISVPPDSRLQISRKILEYLQDSWKSGVWSPGARVLQIFSGNLESGVRGGIFSGLESSTPDFFWKSGVWSPGPGYSRFFLEIWSLESGARVLQIFSGNLESGVRGPGTPDFFWKSGVWSPGPGYSRFFLEIWSARVLQIFSGNLVFRV